ncbi:MULTISPECIES: LptF/LptG family permease [Methylocystis]|uniref:LptF/LptG family permease n=1 Tax=Methylocystis TaxID=133 RepID=UPI00192468A3|nr:MULTISPECIES: LptF/LptG family permease [Methylocystis]MBL1256978.1 LptF/LptG family permease [Methylocystis sp. Sn-Cys]MDJ0448667.1 LptF/LptG family permease [Methylocystis sp. JR02]
MPRLLFFYLFKRVGFSVLIVQLALSVPVVLSYLLYQLPPAAVRGGLVIPALVGVTPTVAYMTLPMAIGVGAALEFSRMASEGMIAVLYALRLSVWSICRPTLSLAAGVVVLGYILANIIAPHYSSNMQDVLNVVRNSLNHRMLDAAHFYTFSNGVKTLYIERWITPDIAANLFIRQISIEKMEEETITAARAEFRRNDSGVIVALSNGSIQTRSVTSNEVRIANFDEYAMALPMQGSSSLPDRGWKGVYELSAGEFLASMKLAKQDHRQFGEWMAEAAKRFGAPALALAHALLAMALTLTFGNITGRRGAAGSLPIIAIPAAHIGFLVGLESLLRISAWFAIPLVAAMGVEIGVSAWLIGRLNYSPRAKRFDAPAPTATAGYAAPAA